MSSFIEGRRGHDVELRLVETRIEPLRCAEFLVELLFDGLANPSARLGIEAQVITVEAEAEFGEACVETRRFSL